jgi:hypothetical protein
MEDNGVFLRQRISMFLEQLLMVRGGGKLIMSSMVRHVKYRKITKKWSRGYPLKYFHQYIKELEK